MGSADFLYSGFLGRLGYEATDCQKTLFRNMAMFISGDDCDIMVVNGYAGTGVFLQCISDKGSSPSVHVPHHTDVYG